jgi:hypothetical protein
MLIGTDHPQSSFVHGIQLFHCVYNWFVFSWACVDNTVLVPAPQPPLPVIGLCKSTIPVPPPPSQDWDLYWSEISIARMIFACDIVHILQWPRQPTYMHPSSEVQRIGRPTKLLRGKWNVQLSLILVATCWKGPGIYVLMFRKPSWYVAKQQAGTRHSLATCCQCKLIPRNRLWWARLPWRSLKLLQLFTHNQG